MNMIDDFNRVQIQRKYVDLLVGSMDFIEVKQQLWSYINKEKNKYSNFSLELEMNEEVPELLWQELADSVLTEE